MRTRDPFSHHTEKRSRARFEENELGSMIVRKDRKGPRSLMGISGGRAHGFAWRTDFSVVEESYREDYEWRGLADGDRDE